MTEEDSEDYVGASRPTVESATLSISMFWFCKYMAKKVTELMEKSFTQDQLYDAMMAVSSLQLLPAPVPKHRSTERRSGLEAQAQAMYSMIDLLDSSNKIPRLVIPMHDMEAAQRALTNSSMPNGEDVSVSARLQSLDKSVSNLSDKLSKAQSLPSIPFVPPAVTVTDTTGPQASFADIVKSALSAPPRNNADPRRINASQRFDRSRSPSTKRNSEELDNNSDGYTEVRKKRNKLKGKQGTSGVNLDALAPLGAGGRQEIYISNTAPDLNEESMKEVLLLCYEDLNKENNNKMEEPLPTITADQIIVKEKTPSNIESPHSKCWRISVPSKYSRTFFSTKFYPEMWRFRRFYAPKMSSTFPFKVKKIKTGGKTIVNGSQGTSTNFSIQNGFVLNQ